MSKCAHEFGDWLSEQFGDGEQYGIRIRCSQCNYIIQISKHIAWEICENLVTKQQILEYLDKREQNKIEQQINELKERLAKYE